MKREIHRVQLSRRKGWRKPDDVVVVSRPTIFGNPFSAAYFGQKNAVRLFRWMMEERWSDLKKVARPLVDNDLQWVFLMMELHVLRFQILVRLPELHGKRVGCWCGLDEECHGDVLVRLATRIQRRKDAGVPLAPAGSAAGILTKCGAIQIRRGGGKG